MDPADLFDPNVGHLREPQLKDGLGWTQAASVEFIYPDGTSTFQTNASISMEGGGSRNPDNTPKHSFRLFFNGDFGSPTKMGYQLFPDSPVDSFDTIILHANHQNTWLETDPTQRRRDGLYQGRVRRRLLPGHGPPVPPRQLHPALHQRRVLGRDQHDGAAGRLLRGVLLRRQQGRLGRDARRGRQRRRPGGDALERDVRHRQRQHPDGRPALPADQAVPRHPRIRRLHDPPPTSATTTGTSTTGTRPPTGSAWPTGTRRSSSSPGTRS